MSKLHAPAAAAAHRTSGHSTATTGKRPTVRRWLSTAAVASAAIGAVVSVPVTAHSADRPYSAAVAPAYPPPTCFASVSSTTVPAGGQLTVSGNCFRPGSLVTIKLDTTVLTRVTANASGVATATVTIPASTTPGTHTISLSGVRSTGVPLVETAQIQVTASLSPSRAVPRDGAGRDHAAPVDREPPLALGGSVAAAFLAGGGGVILRRRRGNRR